MNTNTVRVLLADDDESDRLNFSEALEEMKMKLVVQTVNDGIELMNFLNNPLNRLPDLLFLDLNMPRMNGKECLREIRKSEDMNSIAIAIYSTSSTEKDIEETFLAGANVYIKKPNDFKVLKQILSQVVKSASIYKNPPFNISNFLLRV
ncbi:MAG: response regulator [Chitinophagales bacterium]|nr:response regulator [Chitinophagales bacterium]